MRRRVPVIAVIAAALISCSAAMAASSSASAGGVTATLSYSGSGIQTSNERLSITQSGQPSYDQAVPKTGCYHVCAPDGKRPVMVADLYGDGSQEVVLNLFSGGADCCTIADVFVHSATMQSYVLDQHNFGEAGFVLKDIGPGARPVFVAANAAFYCQFTDCAASGLPLQILEFNAEKFTDITKRYPKLIAADAARWLKLYYQQPSQGQGLIAAWAADEDNLGLAGTVRTVLQLQVADHHLRQRFVTGLERFLTRHHYG